MEILIILILFSIAVAGAFLGAFFWAVRNGQFDDTYTPSVRVLFDDPGRNSVNQTKTNQP